jgi:hypothetical protein
MDDTTIWYLIKFFEREEHADNFLKGQLRLNRLVKFREMEEEACTDGRGDHTEAVAIWLQPNDIIIELTIPGVGNTTITKADLAAPVAMRYSDYDYHHVLCMYAVYTKGFKPSQDGRFELNHEQAAEFRKQVSIDERCFKMGPFAVVSPARPFLNQVREAARRERLRIRGGLVRYYDDETFHGEIPEKDIPFHKQKRFAYQKEFRICIAPGEIGDDPLVREIGEISHFARKINLSDTPLEIKLQPAL